MHCAVACESQSMFGLDGTLKLHNHPGSIQGKGREAAEPPAPRACGRLHGRGALTYVQEVLQDALCVLGGVLQLVDDCRAACVMLRRGAGAGAIKPGTYSSRRPGRRRCHPGGTLRLPSAPFHPKPHQRRHPSRQPQPRAQLHPQPDCSHRNPSPAVVALG